MKVQEPYTPDWRSEEEIAAWLGVDKVTLYRWRSSLGIAWTNINNRTVMYDKKQLTELLNSNSTYAVIGDKLLTA